MSFLPLIVGLALSPNAYAKGGKKKMRLKLSTPMYIMNSQTTAETDRDTTIKDSGVTLFTQPSRLEFTYRVAKGLEVGAMFSFGGVKTATENDISSADADADTDTDTTTDTATDDADPATDTPDDSSTSNADEQNDESIFYLTFAYNFKLAKGVTGFVQPIVGISYQNNKLGDLTDNATQTTVYGADIGTRFKLAEGIHLDLAAEYLMNSGAITDIDDNETDTTGSTFNVRSGLGVRF